MTKRLIIYGGALGTVILLAVIVAVLSTTMTRMPTSFKSGLPAPNGDAQYAYDFDDNRIMVGSAHYIFVGKVLSQVGDETLDGIIAATQFKVDVIVNIKGNISGSVIVNQLGVVVKNGRLTSYNGDKPLQVGATYLFAARYDKNWYHISVPPYDRKLISAEPELSVDQLKALAEQDERVIALRASYPYEKLSPADVLSGITYNSYESLKSGHLFTPPPFVPGATNVPAGETGLAAPPSEHVLPSASPSPTPTVDSTPSPTAETPAPTPSASEEPAVPTPSPTEVPIAS